MKKNYLVLFIFSLALSSFGQTDWMQRGADINGEIEGDQSGRAIDMTSDGNTIVIGAPENDEAETNIGHVRIFDWDGANWTQRGSNIDGEAVEDQFGIAVAISEDGNTIIAGSSFNDEAGVDAGHVRIFDWDGTNWTQKGNDINGEAEDDRFGSAVSISGDGNTIVAGAFLNDNGGIDAGHVRVFNWDGTNWIQRGTAINGSFSFDFFGSAVSISEDGNIIAAGAFLNDGEGLGFDVGHVRIFEWNDSDWIQRGTDINGEGEGDLFGASVALGRDGNTIVAGAFLNDNGGIDAGHVRIFDWNGTDWTQRGDNIEGEAVGDQFGISVAISKDGNTIAAGGFLNNGGGTDAGHVRVFTWSGIGWVQQQNDIDSELEGGQFGVSISLDENGNTFAAGGFSPGDSGNGFARIFDIETVGIFENESTLPINLFPNPNNGTFQVQLHDLINDNTTIRVLDLLGNIIYQEVLNSPSLIIDLNNQDRGVYIVQFQNGNVSSNNRIVIE